MNTIIKWTIGNASQSGFECLRMSIANIKKMMPQAIIVICKNTDKSLPLDLVHKVIDQRDVSMPFSPKGPAWKLCPLRIDINAWEIWIDNDLILYKLPTALQKLENKPFITEAIKRSYSDRLDKIIPEGIQYNTGLIGLPPKFNLEEHISKWIKKADWNDHFEEQSIMTLILHQFKPTIIPLTEVNVLTDKCEYRPGKCGIHFVGLNGKNKHWKNFLMTKLI